MNEAPPPMPLGTLDWGDLRRMEPVSDRWGFDRGQPVDRFHIERFLQAHAADIAGDCVEVLNGDYVRRFGGERVQRLEVVDINADNPNATIVGDLCDPRTLGEARYDCFVLTQTLQVIFDAAAVVRNAWRALKPGGCLLVTVPCLCRYSPHPVDHWRFTDRSLAQLLAENTDAVEPEVRMHGNLVASIAFLTGLAAAELSQDELEHEDLRFPIVVTARARKALPA